MATGDTAPPLSSSPPPLLDNSPSNLSSPLSDVEDKDADPDEMELDIQDDSPGRPGTPKQNGKGAQQDSDADADSDEESKLSEMDINDSEAETERLYDTPPKNGAPRDMLSILSEVGSRQLIERRGRVFERSPSKLQQQLQAELDAENAPTPTENESLSDAEDEDDASAVSSEPDHESQSTKADGEPRLPSQAKKNQETNSAVESTASQHTQQDSQDSRKRKRTSLADQSELEQPLRKRTGSIGVPEAEFSADDAVVADDEGGMSTNPQSGNHTAEEDNIEDGVSAAPTDKEDPVASVEDDTMDTTRGKKTKRTTRGRKSQLPDETAGLATEETQDDPPDDAEEATAPETAEHADNGHNEEVDEETEAANKNEEELERKKAAWEELTAIEKQFSSFRERLYQERLELLNQEEAMLTCENPTHPEYLAMLKCIEERRQERIRRSEVELQLKLSVLRRRAVGERAQMMSQYYQAVRESREKVLEELGQEWYEIQQERRRYANTIPDYGIPFPASKAQTIRQAVAYNKEVSILSGFAKHVGFPAAPPINGVAEDQLESDFEAMNRAREPLQRPNHPPPFHHPHALQPDRSPAGNLFGLVDNAGAQFLEQTPWANPNHPSHQIQRQQQEPVAPPPYSGPPSGARRHSQQPGGMFSSSTTTMNGDSPVQIQKTHPPAVHESLKASRAAAEHANKRETIAQTS